MRGIRTREMIEQEEAERLAGYAVKSVQAGGRIVAEPEHPYRSTFQRDRDRIVHSRAFRRLEYKTQVFIHHEGDHYRNRLTHTLEASQIARTAARALRLNEDLAEAVVLAHDLGHPPFGHAGEYPLNELLAGSGGFDHNRQSLRVVDLLEDRYPHFRGLNLSQETRAGILKHGSAWEHPIRLPPSTPHATLEAQIADRCDEIAYNNHDLDDGLRSRLLELEALDQLDLWRDARERVGARMPEASERILRAQTIVALIDHVVTDLVSATSDRLEAAGVQSVDAVRKADRDLADFSPEVAEGIAQLKRFLSANLYHHPEVARMTAEAKQILSDLYRRYAADASLLPRRVVRRFDDEGAPRAIADYIAGMTDRFARAEHEKLGEAGGRF